MSSRIALHHVDRAQRHEEPARALRLLADDAVRERDPLVEHARLEAARAVAGEDGVAAVEPGAAVGGRRHGEVDALGRRHPLREAADQLQPLGVEVDQHDLRAAEVLALLDEARHRSGAPGRTAADVGDLQPCHSDLQHARVTGCAIFQPTIRLSQDQMKTNTDQSDSCGGSSSTSTGRCSIRRTGSRRPPPPRCARARRGASRPARVRAEPAAMGDLLRELDLDGPAIAFNGALTFRLAGRRDPRARRDAAGTATRRRVRRARRVPRHRARLVHARRLARRDAGRGDRRGGGADRRAADRRSRRCPTARRRRTSSCASRRRERAARAARPARRSCRPASRRRSPTRATSRSPRAGVDKAPAVRGRLRGARPRPRRARGDRGRGERHRDAAAAGVGIAMGNASPRGDAPQPTG